MKRVACTAVYQHLNKWETFYRTRRGHTGRLESCTQLFLSSMTAKKKKKIAHQTEENMQQWQIQVSMRLTSSTAVLALPLGSTAAPPGVGVILSLVDFWSVSTHLTRSEEQVMVGIWSFVRKLHSLSANWGHSSSWSRASMQRLGGVNCGVKPMWCEKVQPAQTWSTNQLTFPQDFLLHLDGLL